MTENLIFPKKLLSRTGGFLKRHKVFSVSVVLIIVLLMSGIHFYKKLNVIKDVSVMNEPVSSPLTRMDLTSSVSLTGNIASRDERSVTTSLTGTEIKEVNVGVGDYVNAGDTIVTFDSSGLERELETAKDNAALNNLKSGKTLEDAAEAVTDAKETYASEAAGLKTDVNTALDHYNQMVSKRDGALIDYQNAQAAVSAAQDQYDSLKAQAESEGWQAKVSDAKAVLDSAQAEYDKAAAVTDIDLTGSLYDNLQNARAGYQDAVAKYETPLSQAENELAEAKQRESQAMASYEEYKSQADAAYGAYYGRLNAQTSSNEKNAKQIEKSQDNYEITALEQSNNKKTQEDQLQEAEEKLGKTVVTAPISGVITAINVEEGDVYNGETLFVIQDMEHFVVEASVDEYDISKISKDLKAVVKTDATGDEQLKGTVSFVAPTPNSTASSGGNTGTANTSPTYKVRIDLEDYDERLRVGMTAKTSIILDSRENVFAVAYDCVQTDEEGNNYIEVLDEPTGNHGNEDSENGNPTGKGPGNRNFSDASADADNAGGKTGASRKIFVEKGMESDYYVEIISDELTEGMQVVTTISKSSNTEGGFMFGEETEFIYEGPGGAVTIETEEGPVGAPAGSPGGGGF